MHLTIMVSNIRNHKFLFCSHHSNVPKLAPAIQRLFWLGKDWVIGMIRSWFPDGLPVLPSHANHKMNGVCFFFPCFLTHTFTTSKVIQRTKSLVSMNMTPK